MKGKTAQRLVLVLAVVAALAPVAESAIVADVLRRGASDNDPPVMAPNPLGEDELCFADRTHEYNMIPEGIVGAGYVQVANNDKTVGDYALEITLLEDATVYLFLDNRLGYGETPGGDPNLPPDIHAAEMGWVAAMGFTDTGTDIGIDESGDGDINQWSSVYVLDATVGTIRLLQQNDVTNPGGRNMYGVAVAMSPSFLIMGDGWAAALESGTVRGMTEQEWE